MLTSVSMSKKVTPLATTLTARLRSSLDIVVPSESALYLS